MKNIVVKKFYLIHLINLLFLGSIQIIKAAEPLTVPVLFFNQKSQIVPYLQIPFSLSHIFERQFTPSFSVFDTKILKPLFKNISKNPKEIKELLINNNPKITAQYLIVDLHSDERAIRDPFYHVVFDGWALEKKFLKWGQPITLKAGLLNEIGIKKGGDQPIAINTLADLSIHPANNNFFLGNATFMFATHDEIAFFWVVAIYSTSTQINIGLFPTLLTKNKELHEVLQGTTAEIFFADNSLNVKNLKLLFSMICDEAHKDIFEYQTTEKSYKTFMSSYSENKFKGPITSKEREYFQKVKAARIYFSRNFEQKKVLHKAIKNIDLIFPIKNQKLITINDFTDQMISEKTPLAIEIPPLVFEECILCKGTGPVIQFDGGAICLDCFVEVPMTVVKDTTHNRTDQVGILHPTTRSIIPADVFAYYNLNPNVSHKVQEDINDNPIIKPEVKQLGEAIKQTGQATDRALEALLAQIGELTQQEKEFLDACSTIYQDRELAHATQATLLTEIQKLNKNFTGSGPDITLLENLFTQALRINQNFALENCTTWNHFTPERQQILKDFQKQLIERRTMYMTFFTNLIEELSSLKILPQTLEEAIRVFADPNTSDLNGMQKSAPEMYSLLTTTEKQDLQTHFNTKPQLPIQTYSNTIEWPKNPTERKYFTVLLNALLDNPEEIVIDEHEFWEKLSIESQEKIASLKEKLTCPICYNSYESPGHMKVILHSYGTNKNHSVCGRCIRSLNITRLAETIKLNCPLCRTSCTLDRKVINDDLIAHTVSSNSITTQSE